ncbi:MAG: ComF family protein [Thermovirgaceae bacterium]|nr:ComF family protein [Synergistales bacterium]MDY0178667.1 ComF family protein [Synergistaceae bacterium]HPE91358.1 ComF family protein [Synergistales bacterium]
MTRELTPHRGIWRSRLERAAGVLLHLLWPVTCPVCGRPGSIICRECILEVVEKGPGRECCSECLRPFPCADHPAAFPIKGLTTFGGLSRELVHSLKYGSRKCLGKPMGRLIGERIRPAGAVALVPVPLHRGSERAFNQSLEIAKGISGEWVCPVADRLAWRERRPSQVGLSAGLRKKLPRDSIAWKGKVDSDLPVVLVDDVCTTGATLRAAAGAVRAAGARVEGALVWALAGIS